MEQDNLNKKLDNCLFFSFCKLQREIGSVADAKFKVTGVAPSHAFLINIVNHSEGIHQKTIGELLHMSPSTITRFIEKLKKEGYLVTKSEGKNVYVYSTDKGKGLQKDIDSAWEDLYESYSKALTKEEKEEFTRLIHKMMAYLSNCENSVAVKP
ncbi:MAG: regulatory protein MarR [Anaerocolumna sp.]|jgi:DNA-binding MarR family transcriptional regulator|nr:regulatory protein MarR [Anaerocolumna sp.]